MNDKLKKIISFVLKFNVHRWYYDQWITTWGLLKHRICTVPEYSGLWNKKGLAFDPELDDSGTCWHGMGYKDCNKNVMIVFEGCKWWHFYPDQTFQEHVDKFRDLADGRVELNFIKSPFGDDEEVY